MIHYINKLKIKSDMIISIDQKNPFRKFNILHYKNSYKVHIEGTYLNTVKVMINPTTRTMILLDRKAWRTSVYGVTKRVGMTEQLN